MTTKPLANFNVFIGRFIGVSVLVCVCLTILLTQAGPRVRQVTTNSRLLSTKNNQKIVLTFNVPIKQVDDSLVTLVPNASYSITTSGSVVTLELKERLLYDTTYKVYLRNITSEYGSRVKKQYIYTFKTPTAQMYYVKRQYLSRIDEVEENIKQKDQLLEATLGSASPKVVFEARKINEFAYVRSGLVVQTVDDEGYSELRMIDARTGKNTVVDLPERGKITNLRSVSSRNRIGFSFTGDSIKSDPLLANQVYTFDIDTKDLRQVKGFSGKTLSSTQWFFAPNGETILAQLDDSNSIIVDIGTTTNILPMGMFVGLYGFSPDGTTFAGQSTNGDVAVVNLTNNNNQVVRADSLGVLEDYMLDFLLLGPGYITTTGSSTKSGTGLTNTVWSTKDGVNTQLYNANTTDEYVQGMGASPNGQYAVIEVSKSEETIFDSYPRTEPTNIRSLLIDLSTGKILQEFDGFGVQWRTD